MINCDYYQGKKDAYNEFVEIINALEKNGDLSNRGAVYTLKHLNEMILHYEKFQELELEKMRKNYE